MNKTTRMQLMNLFMQRVWNQGDFSRLSDMVAPDYNVSQDDYDPWSGQVIDHETFKQRVLYSRNAFPDLNFDIQEMAEGDDSVAIRWIMSGTHTGDLPVLPATGRKFSIPGMTFYYFRVEKICGHSQSFDQFGFLKQMGVF
jgi:steroid delta-isomerase-like uncharacterized protein